MATGLFSVVFRSLHFWSCRWPLVLFRELACSFWYRRPYRSARRRGSRSGAAGLMTCRCSSDVGVGGSLRTSSRNVWNFIASSITERLIVRTQAHQNISTPSCSFIKSEKRIRTPLHISLPSFAVQWLPCQLRNFMILSTPTPRRAIEMRAV